MVEKMKFERKEKRNHVLRCICIVILGSLFGIGYLWIFCNAMENVVRKVSASNVFAVLAAIIFYVLGMILLILILIVVNIAFSFSENAKNKSIEKIQFNVEIDEFLNYLGNREIQVYLKNAPEFLLENLPDNLPKVFKNIVKIRKRRFFVRKSGEERLKIRVFKGKKVVENWIFDYKNFIKYFDYYQK